MDGRPTSIPKCRRFSPCGLVMALTLSATSAYGACDFIPGATNEFTATATKIDRPFASPGEFVEVTPYVACTSAALLPTPEDHVVTVLFGAADDPHRRAVVLAADCDQVVSGSSLPLCASSPTRTDLLLRRRARSWAELAHASSLQRCRLARLPLSGHRSSGGRRQRRPHARRSATIVVTPLAQSIDPIVAPTFGCRDASDTIACVGELFEVDGVCPPSKPHATFTHFVALPPPGDFQQVCRTADICSGTAGTLHIALDRDGNLLIPLDWRGVRVGDGSLPIARLLAGTTTVGAFVDGGDAIAVPATPAGSSSNPFLSSFSLQGTRLPPIFEPQIDSEADGVLTLFGTSDAPASVLRIAQFHGVCVGGRKPGTPCAADVQCPGSGTCGSSLQ